jgi:hypothetical protein
MNVYPPANPQVANVQQPPVQPAYSQPPTTYVIPAVGPQPMGPMSPSQPMAPMQPMGMNVSPAPLPIPTPMNGPSGLQPIAYTAGPRR